MSSSQGLSMASYKVYNIQSYWLSMASHEAYNIQSHWLLMVSHEAYSSQHIISDHATSLQPIHKATREYSSINNHITLQNVSSQHKSSHYNLTHSYHITSRLITSQIIPKVVYIPAKLYNTKIGKQHKIVDYLGTNSRLSRVSVDWSALVSRLILFQILPVDFAQIQPWG